MHHITKSVWWHWQNLTDQWGSKEKRRGFWHGRAWLHGKDWNIRFAWSHGFKDARFTRMTVGLSGGDTGRELTFGIGLWKLFTYWLTFEYPWFGKWMPGEMVRSSRDGRWFKMPVEREIGIRIFNKSIWFSGWANPNEWNADDPWWWSFNINIPDLLFGQEKQVSQYMVDNQVRELVMPESTYQANCAVWESTYKRPRWCRRKSISVTVDFLVPVPVPGKGENSWDCEDDAIYAVSLGNIDSIEAGLARFRENVMRDRERYGGKDWVPA